MDYMNLDSGNRERITGAAYRALSDALTICGRDLAHWLRRPGGVLLGWLFPVMTVLMFGYLFGGALGNTGIEDYFEAFMPGMYVLAMLFGLEATLTAVRDDAARGITDRFRSMPMSGSAVVLGRCLADMLNSAVGLLILVVCGLLVGWRWRLGIDGTFAAFGLLLLLRFSLLWVGIYLGLLAKGPGTLMAVQILVWPLSFLANIFVDPATMPGPLRHIAEWNPASATAAASRVLFGNPSWGTATPLSGHPVFFALFWPLVITFVFFPLSVLRYRHLNR